MKLQDIYTNNLVLTQAELTKDPELLKQIQIRLADLNWYPPHKIDGLSGPMTTKAIADFCSSIHLDNAKTGKYGASFAEALIEAKTVVKKEPVTVDDHIRLILAECKKQGITNRNQLAYILATVQHETAGTFKPIDEIGGPQYLSRYQGRKDLGNLQPGDAVRFKGRGYVQITGRINYTKYASLLNIDLINHPELVKVPINAAFILVHGFRTGIFTGKKISDYITDKGCNFYSCRRCINGLDKAALIASHAEKWVQRLKGYQL